ncbi:CG1143 [Drosophila busckii]|uniref:CG1143 n=1 Tax=Drosophila busckii TaxID=30019 RepID=A0A0M3QW14_DROBS|nr:CG1143 [Drosophila busckii]
MLAAVLSCSLAAPLEFNDLFSGLFRSAPNAADQPQQDVVKRQVLANNDGELKQISFQSLIGDLENSLFQSALSVNGASESDTLVPEITPEPSIQSEAVHSVNKRSEEVPKAQPEERKILLQTTKKVPEGEYSGPAHLLIDRVSVLPHLSGSVPLIPTFQVHHTKITQATIKEEANIDNGDGKQTKISITKTSITSTSPVETLETQSTSANPELSSSTASSTTSAAAGSTTTEQLPSSTTAGSTTETAIVKLKKVEEKLKEKVAEVEAEPIILSARV